MPSGTNHRSARSSSRRRRTPTPPPGPQGRHGGCAGAETAPLEPPFVSLPRFTTRGESSARWIMSNTHVVILAAGKGTRMKSADPKVLHRAGELPLIEHVLRAADGLKPSTTVVVVGHLAERVEDSLRKRLGLRFALQDPQLGTGHALLQAEPHLAGASGTVVLLSGDVPLLRAETLQRLVRAHETSGAAATVLTARVSGPHEYGRIVREGGRITAIVEHKDATPEQRAIDEINSGIYAFAVEPLFAALRSIGSANAQGEYYLPDLVGIYRAQ